MTVEIVNSTLCPPATCHSFTFTIPKHDSLAAIARTRLDSDLDRLARHDPSFNPSETMLNADESTVLSITDANPEGLSVRNMSAATELTFHGVTLTVWTHADGERAQALKRIKERKEKGKFVDSLRSNVPPTPTMDKVPSRRRTSLPWGRSKKHSESEMTGSEAEVGLSDSDFEGVLRRRNVGSKVSVGDSIAEDADAVFDDGGDIYWMPYAITMGACWRQHTIFRQNG